MAGPDLSVVMAAVDFNTVVAAVLMVGAALVVVYIAWKGALIVLESVRGGARPSFGADDWLDFSSDDEYRRVRQEQAKIDIRSKFGRHF